jgi:hypothetical protein
MQHNIENCFLAKSELLKLGFKEEDFFIAGNDLVEFGYFLNEPMLYTNSNFTKSAFELYLDKLRIESYNNPITSKKFKSVMKDNFYWLYWKEKANKVKSFSVT